MRRIMYYEDFQGVLRSRYQETYAKAIVKILELKNETRLECCATRYISPIRRIRKQEFSSPSPRNGLPLAAKIWSRRLEEIVHGEWRISTASVRAL